MCLYYKGPVVSWAPLYVTESSGRAGARDFSPIWTVSCLYSFFFEAAFLFSLVVNQFWCSLPLHLAGQATKSAQVYISISLGSQKELEELNSDSKFLAACSDQPGVGTGSWTSDSSPGVGYSVLHGCSCCSYGSHLNVLGSGKEVGDGQSPLKMEQKCQKRRGPGGAGGSRL
jgi:hypothetical protein